jgi:hypothetical protein
MKLELKHLAPYLPYELKAIIRLREDSSLPINDECIVTVSCFEVAYLDSEYDEFKPILKPLSDLTKEIEVDGKKFIPIMVLELDSHTLSVNEYSNHLEIRGVESNEWSYAIDVYTEIMCKLFEWHFDVFGSIEKGLAIDINTLK